MIWLMHLFCVHARTHTHTCIHLVFSRLDIVISIGKVQMNVLLSIVSMLIGARTGESVRHIFTHIDVLFIYLTCERNRRRR